MEFVNQIVLPPPTTAPRQVWGAREIGRVIGRTPRQTYNLLEAGLLPAKKVGQNWTASVDRLIEAVSA